MSKICFNHWNGRINRLLGLVLNIAKVYPVRLRNSKITRLAEVYSTLSILYNSNILLKLRFWDIVENVFMKLYANFYLKQMSKSSQLHFFLLLSLHVGSTEFTLVGIFQQLSVLYLDQGILVFIYIVMRICEHLLWCEYVAVESSLFYSDGTNKSQTWLRQVDSLILFVLLKKSLKLYFLFCMWNV